MGRRPSTRCTAWYVGGDREIFTSAYTNLLTWHSHCIFFDPAMYFLILE